MHNFEDLEDIQQHFSSSRCEKQEGVYFRTAAFPLFYCFSLFSFLVFYSLHVRLSDFGEFSHKFCDFEDLEEVQQPFGASLETNPSSLVVKKQRASLNTFAQTKVSTSTFGFDLDTDAELQERK